MSVHGFAHCIARVCVFAMHYTVGLCTPLRSMRCRPPPVASGLTMCQSSAINECQPVRNGMPCIDIDGTSITVVITYIYECLHNTVIHMYGSFTRQRLPYRERCVGAHCWGELPWLGSCLASTCPGFAWLDLHCACGWFPSGLSGLGYH